jgi:hypothetical protein
MTAGRGVCCVSEAPYGRVIVVTVPSGDGVHALGGVYEWGCTTPWRSYALTTERG